MVSYKEFELARALSVSFITEKALKDPVFGKMLTSMAIECTYLKYRYDMHVIHVQSQGKDPNRNKEVELRWNRWQGAEGIMIMAFDTWVSQNPDFFRKPDSNTARYLSWAARELPIVKAAITVLRKMDR